jgi:hypothetical protein
MAELVDNDRCAENKNKGEQVFDSAAVDITLDPKENRQRNERRNDDAG